MELIAVVESCQTRSRASKASVLSLLLLFLRYKTLTERAAHLAQSEEVFAFLHALYGLGKIKNQTGIQKNVFCNRYRISFPHRQRPKSPCINLKGDL